MNIIGLDTTTRSLCIGLVKGEEILGRTIINENGYHSEEFLGYLDRILQENDLSKSKIDGYAISIGPGSLTGIRVGLAFLKGIGFSMGKPVVPVRTLFAIAVEFQDKKEFVCPVLATRKDKVFCALYRFKDCNYEIVFDQSCTEIKNFLDRLPDKNILFLGSGALRWKDAIISKCGEKAHFEMRMIRHPDPAILALLGLRKIKEGNIPAIDEIEPIYL